ncbi:MAG TPA: IS200/IS605 family transposase [Tepidisphaeraceae bacterium]|nr:IS200/IS605 family transposase [Tepidisphaeraceae bacterium]
MPQSLAAIHLHVIFSTKLRQPTISADLAPRLHAYMGGIARELGCIAHTINGMDDHVHLLISVAPKISVSDLIGRVKSNSSK